MHKNVAASILWDPPFLYHYIIVVHDIDGNNSQHACIFDYPIEFWELLRNGDNDTGVHIFSLGA